MGIAESIVNLAFGLLLGDRRGDRLAFGLGRRHRCPALERCAGLQAGLRLPWAGEPSEQPLE
jgi:hypothetical protein